MYIDDKKVRVEIDAETLATLTLAALHYGTSLVLEADETDDEERKAVLMRRFERYEEAYDAAERLRQSALIIARLEEAAV